jgi:hypothetical protein
MCYVFFPATVLIISVIKPRLINLSISSHYVISHDDVTRLAAKQNYIEMLFYLEKRRMKPFNYSKN